MSVDNLPQGIASGMTLACLSLALCLTAPPSQAEGMAGWKDLGNEVLMEGKTQLRWTKGDSGQDVNWEDAKAFCAKLGMGWRLPSADELSNVYADAERDGSSAACGSASCKVSPLFKLSGNWYWSGTEVTKDESARSHVLVWGVLLVNGQRNQTFKFMPHGGRALCVQPS